MKCNVIPFPLPCIPSTDDTVDFKHDNLELRFLTLSDVLQFGSGSRFLNFAGKLKFDHDSVSTEKRISGNTCALSITIPVNKRYMCILVIVMSLPRSSWKTFFRLMGLAYHKYNEKQHFTEVEQIPCTVFHKFSDTCVFMKLMRNDESYANTVV